MNKPSKMTFVQYAAADMLDGVQLMTATDELAYRRVCDLIYASGNNLLDDDAVLAHATKSGRKWMAIRARLLAMGKLYIEGGRLCNKRCDAEIARAWTAYAANRERIEKASATRRRKKVAVTPADGRHDEARDVPGDDGRDEGRDDGRDEGRDEARDEHITKNQEPSDGDDPAGGSTPKQKLAKEEAAQRLSIGKQVAALAGFDDARWQGDFSIVSAWLAAGYDAEADILPAVSAVMARKPDGPPQSLGYFTKAIARAHRLRTAGPHAADPAGSRNAARGGNNNTPRGGINRAGSRNAARGAETTWSAAEESRAAAILAILGQANIKASAFEAATGTGVEKASDKQARSFVRATAKKAKAKPS